MKKIDPIFRQKCLSNLELPIKVVIVGLLTSKVMLKLGLTPIEGLDQLYKGKLTGQQIMDLEKLDAIKSIEPDSGMQTM